MAWMEDWKGGKVERWKDGLVECWKIGKMEKWKNGIMQRYFGGRRLKKCEMERTNMLFPNNHNYSILSNSLAKWHPQCLKWYFCHLKNLKNENTSNHFETTRF